MISALGLPDDLLRKLAIAVLLGFGITLMVPPLAARIEAAMSRFAGRAGVAGGGGDGFWSGTAVGASLGLVYAPCAGPILAGVITVSASQSFTAGRLAVALSYGIGSAVVLYFLMLGGRRVVAPLARRGNGLQVAMGAVMVVVALAMADNYDVRFQNKIASDLPGFLVNPTEGLEDTASARNGAGRGARRSGPWRRRGSGQCACAIDRPQRRSRPARARHGARIRRHPGLVQHPGRRPLTLSSLRGRVVLVDFWTYSCINCLRTLPYLTAWDRTYRKDGLTIVGVHSPEFPFEKDAGNVEEAIERNGIHYPVVQDNDLATWSAYGNQYWPAEYFIDARGRVRYAHFGEGEYGKKEQIIRELLAEAGRPVAKKESGAHGIAPSASVTTPETYLGAARAERFINPKLSPGTHDFGDPSSPPLNEFAYRGRWKITLESATAEGGSFDLNFGARRVYLVLGSPGHTRHMRVLLDGRPIPDGIAGSDVHGGVVDITAQRLYNLVDLPRVEKHVLTLEPEKGVMGYAFTFG